MKRLATDIVAELRKPPNFSIHNGLRRGCAEAADELERLDALRVQLRAAVNNPGPHPEQHKIITAHHRWEWPTLWKAIDALLESDGSAT